MKSCAQERCYTINDHAWVEKGARAGWWWWGRGVFSFQIEPRKKINKQKQTVVLAIFLASPAYVKCLWGGELINTLVCQSLPHYRVLGHRGTEIYNPIPRTSRAGCNCEQTVRDRLYGQRAAGSAPYSPAGCPDTQSSSSR